MSFKEPQQVARWLERLQEYAFDVIHRLGKAHTNADALSRSPRRWHHGDRLSCGSTKAVNTVSISQTSRRARVNSLHPD